MAIRETSRSNKADAGGYERSRLPEVGDLHELKENHRAESRLKLVANGSVTPDKNEKTSGDNRIPCCSNPSLEQLAASSSLLMLQGPIGSLFSRIANWKREQGHSVKRVLFNGGDEFYCDDKDAIRFRHSLEEWPSHLRHYLRKYRIDGVLLFGQSRPYHHEARRVCEAMGIPVYVMEEGYMRPGFMTLESGGVNALSSTLSRYRLDEAQAIREPHPASDSSGKRRLRVTIQSMLYYFFLKLKSTRFPSYLHHRHTSIWRYVYYWSLATFNYPFTRWQDWTASRRLDETRPHFFLPLQLDSDAQIVHHSRYFSILSFVDEAMRSFATHAPKDAQLVIKQHPLARGRIGMRREILQRATELGISDRVIFVYACKIYKLLDTVAGVVTVNSTVGLQTIAHAVPLKVMGEAIYDHADVVDRQPLDSFWESPRRPDPALAKRFHRKLKVLTQVPVALYASKTVPLHWNTADLTSNRAVL